MMESELLGLGLISKEDISKQDKDLPAAQEILHARNEPPPWDLMCTISCSGITPLRLATVQVELGILIFRRKFGIRLETMY
jgi:hypothetical protein